MCHDPDGFSFDLGVGMSHGYRGFFMAARDELRFLIPTVVNNGFVQGPEAGAGVGAEIFDVERFDHIHHEIRAAVIRCEDLCSRGIACLGGWVLSGSPSARGPPSDSRLAPDG